MDFSLNTMTSREIIPGFHGKLIHGSQMSLAFWEVAAGAEVPEHHHVHEQIMHVLEGQFEFTLEGTCKTYLPGDVVLIPPHAPHSGRAVTACKLMDIFSPVREEYK